MARIEYDPQIIREYASRLYQHADSLITIGAFLGAIPGASIGMMVGRSMDIAPIGAILGLVFGAVVGGWIGRSLGFKHRLQAQLALCQMRIEENTRVGVARAGTGEQKPANSNAA